MAMELGRVREYLGQDWVDVGELISRALKSDIDLLNSTNGSILSHGGKQLRPMLSLLVARACLRSAGSNLGVGSNFADRPGGVSGGVLGNRPGGALENRPGGDSGSGRDVPLVLPDASKRYAAAAELLHNATLLHDDVADEGDLRRGNPTVRSLLGPTASVLVGDYWLVKAIGLILGNDDASCDPRVIRIFAGTLSCLAEGEMLQLQKASTVDTDYDDYLRIIYSKTASLFEAAAVTAAISVNASGMCLEAVRDYSVSLGYAFQIKDDILDYCGSSSVGKPLGVDVAEQKITLPLLGAMVNVPEREAEIRSLVKDVPGHPANRDRVVRFAIENGGVEYASAKLDEFVAKAVEAVSILAPSEERSMLEELARFTASRSV